MAVVPWELGSSPRMWGKRRGGRTARTHRAVHPHACGGNCQAVGLCRMAIGSSPRMWGKRTCQYGRRLSVRFIPTHVGETHAGFPFPLPTSVHPHACGGNHKNPLETLADAGSSPRMWGKRGVFLHRFGGGRFIPTHVGETPCVAEHCTQLTFYPHACGGNERMPIFVGLYHGSSPRMWGKPGWRRHSGHWRSVHPHACGENVYGASLLVTCAGSSPRMWGKRICTSHGVHVSRFIPTHVGKTHAQDCFHPIQKRFIPTHVGKTLWDPLRLLRIAVHPHACGENSLAVTSICFSSGSSPRMWGKRTVNSSAGQS